MLQEWLILIGYIPPAPNPFTEQRVRAELSKLDRLLDIRWMPKWIFNEKQQLLEGRYVLVAYWPPGDKRYSIKGLMASGQNFDILGAFCEDIDNATSIPANPESMMRVIYERLASCDAMRMPHLKRLKAVYAKNLKRYDDLKKEVLDETEERALEAANGLYKQPFSTVGIELRK